MVYLQIRFEEYYISDSDEFGKGLFPFRREAFVHAYFTSIP